MSVASKHFEIHSHQSDGWSLEEIDSNIDEAIRLASSFASGSDCDASRVITVTFDEATWDVGEVEVHYAGEPIVFAPSKDGEECKPFCTTVEDFYTADAQRAIDRLLKAPMIQWKLTVPELLYHEKYLNKLNDTGQILQGAVQKAAIAQSSKISTTANERVLELYNLVAAATRAIRELSEDNSIPKIENNDLEATLAELKDDPDKQQKLMIALSHYFSGFSSIADKYDQVFRFLDKYDQPEITMAMDMYVSGYLDKDVNIVELLGKETNFGSTLIDYINLLKGTFVGRGDKLERLELINKKISSGLLPRSRQIILLRVEEGITGPRSFVVGNELENILSHGTIYKALQTQDGKMICHAKVNDALEARCQKMLTRETIGKMMGVTEQPSEKIQRLLDINAGVVGAANKNRAAKYILAILYPTYSVKLLVSNNNPVMERLKTLREIQKKIEVSGFFPHYADQIKGRLDEISMIILKENQLLKKLVDQHQNRVGKLMALLKLLSADILTEGKASAVVKAQVKSMLGEEAFFTELMASSSEKSEQMKILKNFQEMLSSAGFAA